MNIRKWCEDHMFWIMAIISTVVIFLVLVWLADMAIISTVVIFLVLVWLADTILY